MIPIAAFAGIIVGLLTGGRFKSILNKRFRLWPLIAVSFFCSFLLSASFFDTFIVQNKYYLFWRVLLAFVQMATFSLFLYSNHRKPGIWLILIGGLMNGLVILFNQGRMPIGQAVLRYGDETVDKIAQVPHYFLMQGGEPFWFFGDIIPAGWYMLSIGDLFIAIGAFLLGMYLSRPVLRRSSATQ